MSCYWNMIYLNYNSRMLSIGLTPIHDLVLKMIEVWIYYDTFPYIKSNNITKIPIKWFLLKVTELLHWFRTDLNPIQGYYFMSLNLINSFPRTCFSKLISGNSLIKHLSKITFKQRIFSKNYDVIKTFCVWTKIVTDKIK